MADIEGVAEINRLLKQMTGRGGKNALRRALGKGSAVVAKIARRNAKRVDDPLTPISQIYMNVAHRAGGIRRERAYKGVVRSVGVLGGARPLRTVDGRRDELPGGNTTHWRLVEFGHTTKNGTVVRAQPFMRSAIPLAAQAAYDATARAVFPELVKEIDKEIRKEISRL